MKCTLRHSLRPGDIGYLTCLHGTVYAREYGYDTTFEAYVAGGLAEFVQSFNPKRDRIWLAESKHHIIGSVAIVGRSKQKAQLRWFFVHPAYREHGIGAKLLKEGLQFSKRRRYKTVFLWTTSELDAARHLYIDCGFKKTNEKEHMIWGKTIREERYDVHLRDQSRDFGGVIERCRESFGSRTKIFVCAHHDTHTRETAIRR